MAYRQNDINNLVAILKAGRAHAQKAFAIKLQLNQQHSFPIAGNQVAARGLFFCYTTWSFNK